MDEQDLAKVPEALRWLRAADLTTDQIDDGTRYSCIRSWTPGPAPFANTRVILLRRKRSNVPGPFFIFVLAFSNLSFQIALPAPQEDKHLIGQSISLRVVPIFPLLDPERVRGPTRYWRAYLRPLLKKVRRMSCFITIRQGADWDSSEVAVVLHKLTPPA